MKYLSPRSLRRHPSSRSQPEYLSRSRSLPAGQSTAHQIGAAARWPRQWLRHPDPIPKLAHPDCSGRESLRCGLRLPGCRQDSVCPARAAATRPLPASARKHAQTRLSDWFRHPPNRRQNFRWRPPRRCNPRRNDPYRRL